MYYCYHTYNIIIIHISSCPIATESTSFTISQLSAAVQAHFNLGILTATRKSYTTGLCKYNTFCREINQPPIPVCEDTYIAAVHYKFGPTRSILCNNTSVPLCCMIQSHQN